MLMAMVLGWCLETLPPFLFGRKVEQMFKPAFLVSGLKFRGFSRVISNGEQEQFGLCGFRPCFLVTMLIMSWVGDLEVIDYLQTLMPILSIL